MNYLKIVFRKVKAFVKKACDKCVSAAKLFVQLCERAVFSPRAGMMASFLLIAVVALAADTGNQAGLNALEQVSQDIAQYVPIAVKLCYAIAGVVAVVGAISVYIKMNNEEQDVKKSIMMIVGACIFLIAAAQALPLFFGIEEVTTP